MELKDFLTIWLIIRKRLWLILLLVVSTVGTIIGVSYLTPQVYSASVKFEVTAPPPVDVSLYKGVGGPDLTEEILRTRDSFIDVLTSKSVAREIIENLQLSMNAEDLLAQISLTEVLPKVPSKTKLDQQLMELEVWNEDPELAAEITNTLVDISLRRFGEIRAKSKTMSREFISGQLDVTGQELNQAQEKLVSFQIENTIGDLQQAIALQQNLIFDLRKNRDLAEADGRLEEVARYEQLILEREVELQNLVRLDLEYADLTAEVEQSRSTYEFLLTKQTEATLKENEILSLGFIQVTGPAKPPSDPLPQVKTSILAIGGILSLIIGIIAAFIWDRLEPPASKSLESPERSHPISSSQLPQTSESV